MRPSSTPANLASEADRGDAALARIDYRRATTDEDRELIYRLRYRAYLQEGAIEPNASGMTFDQFDEAPNNWIFGIYVDGTLASSIRVSVACPKYPLSPSTNVFPDLLGPEVEKGKVIVDPTRFVADPVRQKGFPELPYLTVRLGYVACGHFDADIGLATVRAEHQAFYRRVFLQKTLASPRAFPGLVKPVCLMAADYAVVRDRIFQRYPYFRSTEAERHTLFGPNVITPRAAAMNDQAAEPSALQADPHRG
jgi:N-acyl-L-homoserine lactone synthetase